MKRVTMGVMLLLAATLTTAAELGTVLKADALKAEPFRDAKTISNVAAGTKLEIVSKQGGWLQVKVGKNSGWIKMLSVRKGEASGNKTAADIAGVAAVASGRAGTGKVVSTTGIRGLNEEELKTAQFNEAEVKQLESFNLSKQDAQKFANQAKLKSRQLDYLP